MTPITIGQHAWWLEYYKNGIDLKKSVKRFVAFLFLPSAQTTILQKEKQAKPSRNGRCLSLSTEYRGRLSFKRRTCTLMSAHTGSLLKKCWERRLIPNKVVKNDSNKTHGMFTKTRWIRIHKWLQKKILRLLKKGFLCFFFTFLPEGRSHYKKRCKHLHPEIDVNWFFTNGNVTS